MPDTDPPSPVPPPGDSLAEWLLRGARSALRDARERVEALAARLRDRDSRARLRDSLAGGVAALPRDWRAWRVPGAVALLIAAGPALTLVFASSELAETRADNLRLARRAEPQVAAASAGAQARRLLRSAIARPTAAELLDALARALPLDATLVSATVDIQGRREIVVAAPDPDRLRDGLRRTPGLEGLRIVDQRREEAAMRVTLRELP